jgi:DNA polymerase-3 subunit epsilon
LTLQDIACKPDPIDVLAEFQKLLGKYVDKYDKTDKLYFINFGAEFDSEVLRQWFAKCGDDYYGSWFWHPPIDVMVLAMQDIIGKRHSLKNFKQGSVLDYYGINYSENNLHNADYDAKCAMELYYKIIGEAMPPVERNDDDIPF